MLSLRLMQHLFISNSNETVFETYYIVFNPIVVGRVVCLDGGSSQLFWKK